MNELDTNLSLSAVVSSMLIGRKKWRAVTTFYEEMMSQKKDDKERIRAYLAWRGYKANKAFPL